MTTSLRNGGKILVDQLAIHGATHVFGVPGESYLPILDALYESPVAYITCRQEGGAAMMAEAAGKLTGAPGICAVTRGPGACNASAGLHVASQDSTPMILLVGQADRDMREREAFQEVDYARVFSAMTKWVGRIDRVERIPEYLARAFQTATAGRPGPVVLELPEDVLSESAAVADAQAFRPALSGPRPEDLDGLAELLAQAKRPLAVLGGSGWTVQAVADFTAFAEAFDLPVATSFRRQDRFDNRHPNYAGVLGIGSDPALQARLGEADLLLLLGARFGENPSDGYRLLDIPTPRQRLVHVHPGPEELGRVYQGAILIPAAPPAFAAAARRLTPPAERPWRDWAAAANAAYRAQVQAPQIPGALQMAEVMAALEEAFGGEAIVTNGAGNYTAWPNRYHAFRRFPSQLGPISGTMGYGVPAAIAAKLVAPDRPVVAFAGDGCFQMHGQELATAVQYGLKVIFLVIDNAMLGTIRMHQERRFPGRVSGTDLVNPDFAALARAYGAAGERVERSQDFRPALARALDAPGPALIELKLDPEAITPTTTLSALKAVSGS